MPICKKCGCHFIEGDERTNEKIKAKKALCVFFYFLGKSSFRMPAKIFNTHPSLVYRWVVEASNKLPAYQINETITEIIGKKYTSAIERDNSNTRHHLARFTRRTKVVSQKVEMINTTLKLWQALTNEYFFHIFQDIALTIFI